jgi:hypothetical protein
MYKGIKYSRVVVLFLVLRVSMWAGVWQMVSDLDSLYNAVQRLENALSETKAFQVGSRIPIIVASWRETFLDSLSDPYTY